MRFTKDIQATMAKVVEAGKAVVYDTEGNSMDWWMEDEDTTSWWTNGDWKVSNIEMLFILAHKAGGKVDVK